MVTERGEGANGTTRKGTQLSGKLMLSTINQNSATLPNILPAVSPNGVQSDVRLVKNDPNQPPISFSP